MASRIDPAPGDFDRRALRELRRQLDMTQTELAEAVGYDGVATISKLESGYRKPSREKWLELAKVLRVPPEALAVGGAEPSLYDAVKDAAAFSKFAIMEARQRAKENETRRTDLERAVRRLEQQTSDRRDKLGERRERARECIEEFNRLVGRIEGLQIPEDIRGTVAEDPLRDAVQMQHLKLRCGLIEMAGKAAAGAGAGAAAGAAAAAAVYTAVAATATASTGAAMAGLTGAAATSATLAWLGGGSLAAGGIGVAGGTLVLSGIIAAPALIAAGIALALGGRRLRDNARSDAARLAAAERALARTTSDLETIWRWQDQSIVLLDDALAAAPKQLEAARVATPEAIDGVKIDWDSMSRRQQEQYLALTILIATIVNILSLPVTAIVDEDLPAKKITDIIEWNDLVLADSRSRLDEWK